MRINVFAVDDALCPAVIVCAWVPWRQPNVCMVRSEPVESAPDGAVYVPVMEPV